MKAATSSVVLATPPVASVRSEMVSSRPLYVADSVRFGAPGSTLRTCTPFMPWLPNLTVSTMIAATAGSPR